MYNIWIFVRHAGHGSHYKCKNKEDARSNDRAGSGGLLGSNKIFEKTSNSKNKEGMPAHRTLDDSR